RRLRGSTSRRRQEEQQHHDRHRPARPSSQLYCSRLRHVLPPGTWNRANGFTPRPDFSDPATSQPFHLARRRPPRCTTSDRDGARRAAARATDRPTLRRPVPRHRSPAPSPPASRSPMIPATINPMQTSRTTVAGSRNSTIPSTAVPTVPIPVQTAYAVPIGSDLTASPSSPMLAIIDATVRTVGQSRVNPSVYFRPTAHPIPNSPATTSIPQAIPGPLCSRSLPHVLPRLGLHLNPDLQQVGRGLGLRREQLRRAKERLAQRGRFHIHHLVALPRVAVPNRHPVPSHGSLRAG